MDALSRNVQVLGIDAGGTLTDTFFVDAEGEFVVGKAQSTPENESIGLLKSSEDGLADWNLAPEDALPQLQTGVYSGTAMLNRVVQRKGLKCGLIVNAGVEDFHRMGRAVQSHLGYALPGSHSSQHPHYDPPLVPRYAHARRRRTHRHVWGRSSSRCAKTTFARRHAN